MAVQPLASQVGVAPACRALGVPRASFHRRQRPAPGHQQPRPTPARALRASERAHVLDVRASPRFVDRSPAEVVATLLDEGQYLCAERTMYRILAANQPVRERRNQRSHPCYTKPELVATGPNQTWSWDITRLRGPKRWTSFYLYVLLDIFSRYVVGWMVADRENAALAATLIEETCLKQGIEPQVLTLHSDRGAPMTSKCTAQLLADLGVTRSLSRPQVSDDNPFSEAQFKTLKYHPGFPGRFEDITAAIAFCRSFFPWYNTEHRHAGIAMLTPDDVHHHRAPDVLAQRGRTLQAAWALHPERFVHGTPKPAPLPEAVWINPPATSTTGETSQYIETVGVSKSLTGSARSYDREDMVFDPIHYLPLLEHKIGALDQAAPLAGWELPDAFPTLRRLLEARMGKAGKREYVQVLRLVETFDLEVLHGAVKDALRLGAIGYDAVKHLVLCRIERRPPKLDLDIYPYLPRANVATTAAASYMSLLGGGAS